MKFTHNLRLILKFQFFQPFSILHGITSVPQNVRKYLTWCIKSVFHKLDA